MRMNARRTTKVVVDTTKPGRPTQQSPHIVQTLRAGACRGAGFVAPAASRLNVRKLTSAFAETKVFAVLAHGAYHVLRPASRHHPRQAARRARAGVLQRLLRLKRSAAVTPATARSSREPAARVVACPGRRQ